MNCTRSENHRRPGAVKNAVRNALECARLQLNLQRTVRQLVRLHSGSVAVDTSERQLCLRLVEDGNRIESAGRRSSAEVVIAIEMDSAREGNDDPYRARDDNKGAQQFVGSHWTNP